MRPADAAKRISQLEAELAAARDALALERVARVGELEHTAGLAITMLINLSNFSK
jgi:two-component system sensor histidine kinase FlrB